MACRCKHRDSMERTINEVITLQPDRIAFYSYAHVPWTSKAQRLFDEADLPDAETKIQLYLKGKQLLTDAGYADIGMDHFALPHDELYSAGRPVTCTVISWVTPRNIPACYWAWVFLLFLIPGMPLRKTKKPCTIIMQPFLMADLPFAKGMC